MDVDKKNKIPKNALHDVQAQLHFFSIPTNRGNTLLDYDLIPKFFHDRAQKKIPVAEQDPNNIRSIRLNDSESYEILPAIIDLADPNDKSKRVKYAIYPGTRESLIEDCLISFAQNGEFSVEKGEPGYRVDGLMVGVYFTLHQLRAELKKRGKEYKGEELKQGLDVLMRANYIYTNNEGREKIGSYIVGSLDSVPNPKTSDKMRSDRIVFVTFDSIASSRILSGHYRIYDVKKSLQMKSPISRYLYKQFTHHWQQANNNNETGSVRCVDQNETILASGCPLSGNPTKRKTNMQKALDELHKDGIIQKVDKYRDVEVVKDGKRIVNNFFMVRPTNAFISQQINGYKQMRKTRYLGDRITEKTQENNGNKEKLKINIVN